MVSQEEVYIDYLNYNWESFLEFQDGLKEILDNYLESLKEQDSSITSIPALDKQQLIDQAKSFFYCSHTGNILNLDDFNSWKIANGDKYIKDQRISEVKEIEEPKEIAEESTKAESAHTSTAQTSSTQNDSDEPPYSSNYQELVELIMSGKEVPGIKQIPDTVLPEKSSAASAPQRVKPWEKQA